VKKIILIAVVAVVLLGGGIGSVFVFLSMHHSSTAANSAPPPPKLIYFAELADLVITVPADSGDATPTYVQMTLQFSTFDTNAVTVFTNLQPIIKAEIIELLMGKTAKSLMDPSTHNELNKACLGITNQVLNKAANYTPPNPFTAGYITNLVEQN
jgi:flagellar basal body-associated protein FliL